MNYNVSRSHNDKPGEWPAPGAPPGGAGLGTEEGDTAMLNPPRIRCLASLLMLALLLGGSPSRAEVRMTEVDINDANQRAELLNTGPAPVDLTSWTLQTLSGSFPLSGVINVNQHRVFNLPTFAVPLIRNRGDCLELFDPNLDALVDRVLFGDTGGAPLDIQAQAASSLSRAAGGADPGGGTSATAWTVDFSSTFGNPNNAPAPNFTPTVRINEIIPQGGVTILAELYDRTGGGVNVTGYTLTTGQDSVALTGSIPPGGWAVFDITSLTFEFSLNLYLFNSTGVRIDQQGLSDAPGSQVTWLQVKAQGESLGRYPDGQGPGTGFDLSSSGYPVTLQRMPRTPGGANIGQPGSVHVPLSPIPTVGAAFVLMVLASWKLAGRSRARR